MKTKAISKIVLQIAGKEIELTPAQARKLHKELNALFETERSVQDQLDELRKQQPEKEYIPIPYPPMFPAPQPIYVNPYSPTWNPGWQVWCGDPIGTTSAIGAGTLPSPATSTYSKPMTLTMKIGS